MAVFRDVTGRRGAAVKLASVVGGVVRQGSAETLTGGGVPKPSGILARGQDGAAVHAVEADGHRAAVAEGVDARDAAGDAVVVHHRIAAAQTVHIIEDDRRLHFAAVHEGAGAEPDGGGEGEQEHETEQLAHANSL